MGVFGSLANTQIKPLLIQRLELAVEGMGKAVNLEHLELIVDSILTSGEVNGASMAGYMDLCRTLARSTPFSNAAFQVRIVTDSVMPRHLLNFSFAWNIMAEYSEIWPWCWLLMFKIAQNPKNSFILAGRQGACETINGALTSSVWGMATSLGTGANVRVFWQPAKVLLQTNLKFSSS